MTKKLKISGLLLFTLLSLANAKPVFYGPIKITVPNGTSVDLKDPLYRIFARDDHDGDISEKIFILPENTVVMQTENTTVTATAAEQKRTYSVANSKGDTSQIEVSIIGSGSTILIQRQLYTLPDLGIAKIEIGAQERANGQDKQHLGIYMPNNSTLKIKRFSDYNTAPPIKVTLYQGVDGKNIDLDLADTQRELKNTAQTGGIPMIITPKRDEETLPVIEVEFSGDLKKLDYYHYKDDMDNFLNKWTNNSFALIGNRAVQLMVPIEDKNVLTTKNIARWEAVVEFSTIDALLEFYEDLCDKYNQWSGFYIDEENPLHKLIHTKFFVLPQSDGPGAAYYSGDHCGLSGSSLDTYLAKAWVVTHELGHGYDGNMRNGLMEIINNVFGHYYQTTYLDFFNTDDHKYSWTLDYGYLSWDQLNEQIMKRREDNYEKLFDDVFKDMDGNTEHREKLGAMIMLFNATGSAGEALAQIYRFDREMREVGKSLPIADLIAKGIYNSDKLNVIPFMESFGLFPSENIKMEIYEAGNAKIPYNLHYLTDDNYVINNEINSKNVYNKHSLVISDEDRQIFGTAKITIKIDDAGFDIIKGKKIKIKDGSKIVDEIDIASKEVNVKSIPVGAYTIVLPSADRKYITGNYYLLIKDNQETDISVEYTNPNNLVSDAMQLVIGGAPDVNVVAIVSYNSKTGKIIVENTGNEPHWVEETGPVYAGLKIESSKEESLVNNYKPNETLPCGYREIAVNIGDKIYLWHAEAGRMNNNIYEPSTRCYVKNAITNEIDSINYQIIKRDGDRNPGTTTLPTSITLVVTEFGLVKEGTTEDENKALYTENFQKILETLKENIGEENWGNSEIYKDYKANIIYAAEFLSYEGKTNFLEENEILFTDAPTKINKLKNIGKKYGILFDNSVAFRSAEISIITPESSEINLMIYDNVGNIVFEKSQIRTPKTIWNLTNTAGRTVANGAYLVVVEAKGLSGQRYYYSAKLGVKR